MGTRDAMRTLTRAKDVSKGPLAQERAEIHLREAKVSSEKWARGLKKHLRPHRRSEGRSTLPPLPATLPGWARGSLQRPFAQEGAEIHRREAAVSSATGRREQEDPLVRPTPYRVCRPPKDSIGFGSLRFSLRISIPFTSEAVGSLRHSSTISLASL